MTEQDLWKAKNLDLRGSLAAVNRAAITARQLAFGTNLEIGPGKDVKHFGTDGVRGLANERLTPELALSLGLGAGAWLRETGATPRAVIGRDSRQSGTMLGAALAAGLCAQGIEVVTLGISPTPTIAFIARTGDFGLGAIVSASHNPAPDNGIKFVGHDGRKLSDAREEQIEGLMIALTDRPTGVSVGAITADPSLQEAYLRFLEGIVPERLDGMRIALDCAHGAAYAMGPEILRRLGALVTAIGVEPNGRNINAEGGATKPQTVQDLTVRQNAEIGVAFDGDADRCVFSDEKGTLINGDRTIGIWAAHQQRAGKLQPPVVVGTVMSNGGFEAYLTSMGIALDRAKVGDKYVAERIEFHGARIGGEQSGHIIFPERGPTGDGLATMLELLAVIRREGRPASSFVADYEPWPQVMTNLAVEREDGWDSHPEIVATLAEAESALANHGRINVRKSGTQPVFRIMVEADGFDLRDQVEARVVDAISRALGGRVEGRVDLTHALGD